MNARAMLYYYLAACIKFNVRACRKCGKICNAAHTKNNIVENRIMSSKSQNTRWFCMLAPHICATTKSQLFSTLKYFQCKHTYTYTYVRIHC